MIRFKNSSIGFQNLSSQLLLAIIAIEGVFVIHGADLVITSLNDSEHSKASLHYSGNAVDIRSRDILNKQTLLDDCKKALGGSSDFDMILESNHYHLEYQPKRRV